MECDGFLANNTQMGSTLETAEKLKTLHERFLESIQVQLVVARQRTRLHVWVGIQRVILMGVSKGLF